MAWVLEDAPEIQAAEADVAKARAKVDPGLMEKGRASAWVLEPESQAAAAPATKSGNEKPGIVDTMLGALKNRVREASEAPMKAYEAIKARASDPDTPLIPNPLDLLPKAKPSTALPLSLPGGGTVLSRIAATGAGHMLENPQPTVMGNVKEVAKGAALPALVETIAPGAAKLFRSTGMGQRAINRADTRRVGQEIADVTGAPAARTPGDLLDQATGAATRRAESAAAHQAAMETHQQAVATARSEAARLTREGRAAQAAEWQRTQARHQAELDALAAEARQGAATLQRNVDAMTNVANERRRGQAAEGVRDVINRVTPQLESALQQPGAAGLRRAGAGGARDVLSEGKEAVVRQLEQGAPDGILVPALSDQPVPVRDALWALSEIGAGRGAQFARNPLDRDINGAIARLSYGDVANQIRAGFNNVQRGLGDLFQQGQQTYREGLAVTKTLLEPGKNWTVTGDVNVPTLARDIIKPRNQRVLVDKLGPERAAEVTQGVTNLPRELGPQRAPKIQPREAPPAPERPAPFQAVTPSLPPAPAAPTESSADAVMRLLFGPQNRIQQGRDTLVNMPAVQRALQTPAVRAEITARVGEAGYDRILRSALRGAPQGADEVAGRAPALLSGRGSYGAWRIPLELVRRVFPNASSSYVGQVPYSPTAPGMSIADIVANALSEEATR